MYAVILRFADKARAPALMEAHKEWITRGFDDGVFLLVGGLQPDGGGAILAHGLPRADLEARVAQDPFVEHGVVHAEILEIAPGRTDARLAFLKAGQ
ncbi:YciI family protein [Novosphingobium beihaiensis]|uniref:YCII-related domain-containing protein n=1 Tax=Novosphingobium beihaiensis TaxID=2930389 RepID=A0ABT0BQW2_9SPHN|nr:hypothetical protein [Novosphingobium beihaiensis]MCJ2187437.1 hypothetical protein [Novosphingobium beihaiensis]